MENKPSGKRRVPRKSDLAVLRWLWRLSRGQGLKFAVLIICNVLTGAASVVFAGLSKGIIDSAVEYADLNRVLQYALYLLLLLLLQLALHLTGRSVEERLKARLEMALKGHMLKQILQKDYAAVSAYHTGDLQNRMFNDVRVVSDSFATLLPGVLAMLTRLLCAFIYLLQLDMGFALVFLAAGCVVAVCSQLFRKTIKRLHKNVQESEGKTRSFIQEAVSNLLVIKAFSAEKRVEERTETLQQNNFRDRMKRRTFSIASSAGISTVFSGGYVLAIAYGALRILDGTFTYGTVTAILQLVNQIQQPILSLSSVMPSYFSLLASAERLIEIEKLPNEPAAEKQMDARSLYASLESVEFSDISFSYGRVPVLEHTSFSFQKGDFVAVTGISGIGKSTLLKLLLGVFPPQGGQIVLHTAQGDCPVSASTRALFAYVPQGNMLLSGTILENLTFMHPSATEKEIHRALEISCADTFINELPNGLHTVIGEHGYGLSEGQVQRLAIARSLLSGAPVLLLDEATSALDEETERRLLLGLQRLQDVTCLIVSHKKAALEICNKHVQIEDHKICNA